MVVGIFGALWSKNDILDKLFSLRNIRNPLRDFEIHWYVHSDAHVERRCFGISSGCRRWDYRRCLGGQRAGASYGLLLFRAIVWATIRSDHRRSPISGAGMAEHDVVARDLWR